MKSAYKRLLSLLLVLVMVMSMVPAAQAAVSTTKNVMFFDLASPNYTTTLSSQIAVTYKPNGTGSKVTAYIKNLGWHYARYGGTAYVDNPLYCIEPNRNYGASTSYNTMDTGVSLTGSGSTNGTNTWYALPQSYREAIMLILLYSDQLWDHSVSVYDVARDDNMNVPLRIATQFLIYEIVCGLRNPDTFDYQWGGYTDADIFYWAGEEISWFVPYYNSIVSSIQAAKVIPSFTSSSSGSAPTITLSGDQTSVTDSNGVLANFSFSAGNGASFSKSGNTLYITQTGDISESTVFTATRSVPSAGNSAVAVYSPADTSYQTCVNLYSASNGNINAYFKLKAPAKGNINVVKTTSDNLNLAGWKFSVYADAACTSLVAGPSTTGSNGQLTFSGLSAGTFYVKEVGHSSESTAALYSCESTNPQKVTVTSGGTATVRFSNRLNTGTATLIKNTNTGSDRAGWQIGVYTDSGCTSAVSGSPFTTGQDGTVSVALQPGTYYAKELSTGDSYWECDSSVKTFTVKANETATITFTNTQYGRIQFQKSTNTGNHLEGWVFRVRDAEGNTVGEYTTDSSGYAVTGNLPLGRYTVVELPTEDDYWQVELGFHDVTVRGGETTVDAWTNNEQGLAWVYKETNTDEVKVGKDISVRPPGKERFVRLTRNFGVDYTLESIRRKILEQPVTTRPLPEPPPRPQRYRLSGNWQKRKKATGFRALYFHYCYLLGVFPRNKSQNQCNAHFLLKEDLIKLDQITQEARLLARCHIDTGEQLAAYRSDLESRAADLTSQRRILYKQQRTVSVKSDESRLAEVKAEITQLSGELGRLRQELKLCDGIAQRSGILPEKLQTVRKDDQPERKEKYRHGKFR